MTPAEFYARMQNIADTISDPEGAHRLADDLLCDVLMQLGYGDGVAVFEDMDKWYE
jgi:hypothetical protein